MTLKEILFGGGSALFVLLTLLQLAPIKINPWSAIAKAFGRAINSEVLEKVGKLESELQCVRSGMAEEKAVNCRARIHASAMNVSTASATPKIISTKRSGTSLPMSDTAMITRSLKTM